jgi:hypothetical protein
VLLVKYTKNNGYLEMELFRIIKHGLKSAGMPAFGPTHTERQLKTMTAFVNKIYGMSPEEYAAYRQGTHERKPIETHGHGAGTKSTGRNWTRPEERMPAGRSPRDITRIPQGVFRGPHLEAVACA